MQQAPFEEFRMSTAAFAQAEPVGQPPVLQYAAQPAVTYAAAPAVTYAAAPATTYTAAPAMTYAAPAVTYAAPPMPEVQYVNELGQPCTADGQPLGGEVQ